MKKKLKWVFLFNFGKLNEGKIMTNLKSANLTYTYFSDEEWKLRCF